MRQLLQNPNFLKASFFPVILSVLTLAYKVNLRDLHRFVTPDKFDGNELLIFLVQSANHA